jgi:hypothetical protein
MLWAFPTSRIRQDNRLMVSVWARFILLIAAFKALLGFCGLVVALTSRHGVAGPTSPPLALTAGIVLIFGCAGALLVFGGRRDRRAVHLGGFLLLTTTSMGDRGLRLLAAALSSRWAAPAHVLDALEVDAFLACRARNGAGSGAASDDCGISRAVLGVDRQSAVLAAGNRSMGS